MTGTSGGKTADSNNVMWKNKIRKLHITLLKKKTGVRNWCLTAWSHQLSEERQSDTTSVRKLRAEPGNVKGNERGGWRCVQKPRGCVDTTPPFSTMAALMARRFLKSCLDSPERKVWMFPRILSCACKSDRVTVGALLCLDLDTRDSRNQFQKNNEARLFGRTVTLKGNGNDKEMLSSFHSPLIMKI